MRTARAQKFQYVRRMPPTGPHGMLVSNFQKSRFRDESHFRDDSYREAVRTPTDPGGGEKSAWMIDQFKQAFQEEARELLVELESALLELDQNRDDGEVVGRAFRALHTIKGSGAMFGFDD